MLSHLSLLPNLFHSLPSSSSSSFSQWSALSFRPATYFHSLSLQERRSLHFCVRASSSSSSQPTSVDYYATLNLHRDASLQEIKSSYRKLAREYHPDMNKSPGAEDKFKEISAAYEVLSDVDKRSLYDRFGEAGIKGYYQEQNGASQRVDPFEVFDSLFGESNGFYGGKASSSGMFGARSDWYEGVDIRYDLSISFEESIFGRPHKINVVRLEICEDCKGKGTKSRSGIVSCKDCGGKGGTIKTQRTPFGIVSEVSSCSTCGGAGKVIKDPCQRCKGESTVWSRRTINVNIPPGVSDGITIKVRGEGHLDKRRGTTGDICVVLHVDEKHGFRRNGLDLYSDTTVDYTEAILGTTVKVETVEGLKDLRIPPGTQPGETIKIPSVGVPNINNPSIRGDHHFVVNIRIPKKISDAEKDLIQQLDSLSSSGQKRKYHSYTNKTGQRPMDKENVNSFWDSFTSFIRMKQTRTKFAALTMEVPLSMCHSVRLYPSNMNFMTMVLAYVVFSIIRQIPLGIQGIPFATKCITKKSLEQAQAELLNSIHKPPT